MADIALLAVAPTSQGSASGSPMALSRIEPRSVHGLLWLQTHFEDHQWELICSGRARLSASSTEQLRVDAEASGLTVVCQTSNV